MKKNTDIAFDAGGRPTLIGSLPTSDHEDAIKQIFASTPEIPLWPQLPSNPKERMLNQFIEHLPGIIENDEQTLFNVELPGFEDEQLKFYEEYLQISENPATILSSRFAISRERAPGLYFFADTLSRTPDCVGIKGQITGPFTLLTGLNDHLDRLAYYDPTIREMVVKDIAMKAAWQVFFLKQHIDLPILLFIDEPALAGLGSSAFISVSLDDIAQDLSEVCAAIHQAGGLAGTHVCANTDWNLLLESNIDIISFDAYNFFDRFITCKDRILNFLSRGSIIAWGIIPTSEEEDIQKETSDSLAQLWEEQAKMLSGSDLDLPAILRQTLITPSCGTGALSPEMANRVLSLTHDVSAALRQKYGD